MLILLPPKLPLVAPLGVLIVGNKINIYCGSAVFKHCVSISFMTERVKLIKTGPTTMALKDRHDNQVANFVIREDLEKALVLLKKINNLRAVDGAPIYKTRLYNGISTWSFHQHSLYLPALSEFIKYDEVMEFFYRAGAKYEVEASHELTELVGYMEASGVRIIKSFLPLVSLKKTAAKLMKIAAASLAFFESLVACVKLIVFRPTVLVYSPDKLDPRSRSDFRVSAVYDYLREQHVPYIEIVHTLFGREFMKNIWERKRLVIYKELFTWGDWLEKNSFKNYDLSSIEERHRKVVTLLINEVDKSSRKSVRFIKNFSRLLKLAKVKLFVSLDDMRHVQEIICACRSNGVKSYGFQHGHITKFHAGWMNYEIPKNYCVTFDKLFVWNDYWKKALLEHSSCYDESNVEAGGELRPPPEIHYQQRTNPPAKISDLCLLIPYESIAPKDEIKPYIKRLKDKGARLIFKLRPDVSAESQLNEYGLSGSDAEVVSRLNSDVLARVDAAVGVYTTFLYEMIFYEKPVFILRTSFALGLSLVEDEVASELREDFSESDILDAIKNFQSKKRIAWPVAPRLKDTLRKVISL